MGSDDPVVLRYLRSLEAGDFDDAARCFSENAFYSHPPRPSEPPGSPRHETRGRQALRAYFDRRGKIAVDHSIDAHVLVGDRGFLLGHAAVDGRELLSFVAEYVLDRDGLIAHYAAYTSIPPVGSTRGADHAEHTAGR